MLARDGFTCQACGAGGKGTKLEVHHRLSRWSGGGDEFDNLTTLCKDCHQRQRHPRNVKARNEIESHNEWNRRLGLSKPLQNRG